MVRKRKIDAQKYIRRSLRHHREWMRDVSAEIWGYAAEAIPRKLAAKRWEDFFKISISLGQAGIFFGIRGIVSLVEGNKQGWQDILFSIDFIFWDAKIEFRVARWILETTENPKLPLAEGIHLKLLANLFCVSSKWRDEAARIFKWALSVPEMIGQDYWQERRFEPFVASCMDHLKQPWTKQEAKKLPDPYRAVALSWNDDAQLVKALYEVCEYHCEYMYDHPQEWDPPFFEPPFDLLPGEVMLVNWMRSLQGKPPLEVDHPLTRVLPLSGWELPEIKEEHEWIREVAKAYRRFYPHE